jgi:hypothetical protein
LTYARFQWDAQAVTVVDDQGTQKVDSVTKDWDESKHPRAPKGSEEGGRFTASDVSLTSHDERAWSGKQEDVQTQMTRQESGALGEKVVLAYLKMQGAEDAAPLNMKTTNFPVDLIAGNEVVEVKTGTVANGKSAQQWRATIGQPGKEEAAWLKTASPADKAAWNQQKAEAILARKAAAVKQLSQEYGRRIKGVTMTVILHPDKKIADIYRFQGFHSRIGWSSDQAKKGFVGSFKYE